MTGEQSTNATAQWRASRSTKRSQSSTKWSSCRGDRNASYRATQRALLSALRSFVVIGLLITAYALAPWDRPTHVSALWRLVVWLALVVVCTFSYVSYLAQRYWAAAAGGLSMAALGGLYSSTAVTVVLAAADYPERGDSGTPIEGIDEAEATGALVFHAATARRGSTLLTNGGRILNVTATGDDLPAARTTAYDAAARISFRWQDDWSSAASL